MARDCVTCSHPQREAIDEALLSGKSARSIAKELGLHHRALSRHFAEHVKAGTKPLAPPVIAEDDAPGPPSVIEEAEKLLKITRHLVASALRENRHRDAMLASREHFRSIEQVGRLRLKLASATGPSLTHSEEWARLQGALLSALKPHPEARQAVVKVLTEHFGGRS